MERRIRRLEDLAGAPGETERERKERLKTVREQAEHANRCHRGEVLPFVVDEAGDVFSSRDGKPITDPRQTFAEEWYWEEVEVWDGEGLVHDEEAQTFYARTGELAISRDMVDLRHLMGDARWAHLGDLRDR
ncbi:MAG: hypothetical protein M3Q60_02415 [Actinomycetota bacterium]|nr:hypothetical protein [Actinomycetota bacterium]MDP9454645.1 hypothetical protein [Actinomycetota bacterium]